MISGTPGLIDTHAHIADGGVAELYGVKLSDATSIAEIVARVKAKVALIKPGEWVIGSGWDEGKLEEYRYVTASDLDAVSPENPVWLLHTTGHYGAANSLALKLAHINRETLDPPAGTIDRDRDGNPTGVLKEDAAMRQVIRLIPPKTPEQMRQGILYIQNVLHSEGMTAGQRPIYHATALGRIQSAARRGAAQRTHLRAVGRGHDGRIGKEGAGRDQRSSAVACYARQRPAAVLRRQDLYGRLGRGAHRLGL
jgi:predicted amidohydrolase YtcJ